MDVSNNQIDVDNYFADTITKFIEFRNITTNQIKNSAFEDFRFGFTCAFEGKEKHYTNEKIALYDSTLVFKELSNNTYFFNYTVSYSCTRKLNNQKQICDIDIKIGFDENLMIKSYEELMVRNLKFENSY
jgi:hypothetical protein